MQILDHQHERAATRQAFEHTDHQLAEPFARHRRQPVASCAELGHQSHEDVTRAAHDEIERTGVELLGE